MSMLQIDSACGRYPRSSSDFMGGEQEGAAALGPLYPALDNKPLAPIQYGNSPQSNASSQSLMDADVRPARSAAPPSPRLELQLGPQEMQVDLQTGPWDRLTYKSCVAEPASDPAGCGWPNLPICDCQALMTEISTHPTLSGLESLLGYFMCSC